LKLLKFVRILLPVLLVAAVVSGCRSGTEPPGGSTAGSFTPTVDATGVTDVSDQMAAFLASVPDGSTVTLRAGGLYRMEKTFSITRRRDLTIRGNGATVKFTTPGDGSTAADAKSTRARPNVRIIDSSGISISDLHVIGANPLGGLADAAYQPGYEAQHGFDVLNSTRVSLIGCSATDTFGDFIYIGGGYGNLSRSTDVLVRGFTGLRSGRQGITMTEASRIVIENSTLSEIRRSTIDFEPESAAASVDNVTIRNNRIFGGRLNFVAAHGRGPINHITVQGNRLTGQALSVQVLDLDGGRRSDWKVLDNASEYGAGNPSLAVMSFDRVDGLWVERNRQVMALRGAAGGPAPLMYLVKTANCTDQHVDGNTVVNGAGELPRVAQDEAAMNPKWSWKRSASLKSWGSSTSAPRRTATQWRSIVTSRIASPADAGRAGTPRRSGGTASLVARALRAQPPRRPVRPLGRRRARGHRGLRTRGRFRRRAGGWRSSLRASTAIAGCNSLLSAM
jgi:hypothetical protein